MLDILYIEIVKWVENCVNTYFPYTDSPIVTTRPFPWFKKLLLSENDRGVAIADSHDLSES